MARGIEICSSLSILIKEKKTEFSEKQNKTKILDWYLVGECCFGAMA